MQSLCVRELTGSEVTAQRALRSRPIQSQSMPEMRPTDGFASVLKADGEKSRSVIAQPVQRSVIVTVTLLPW